MNENWFFTWITILAYSSDFQLSYGFLLLSFLQQMISLHN